MFRAVFVIIFIFLAQLFSQTAIAPVTGDGSSGNPYQIATLENLYWVATDTLNWDKNYTQTADINASETVNWFNGTGWSPIGNSSIGFTGSYNGMNHMIEGLFINRPTTNNVGLFGALSSPTSIVSNIILKNTKVTGSCYVGSLAGSASGDMYEKINISRCSSVGCIINGYFCTGGLIGNIGSTAIVESYATGNVSGNHQYTGGLIGFAGGPATISYCYSLCNVEGVYTPGGLAGFVGWAVVSDCYSTGSVTGQNSAGGLVGDLDPSEYMGAIINKSFSTGRVKALYAGGLIGYLSQISFMVSGWWDKESSGTTTSWGGTGKTTAEMKSVSTFSGLDFTTIWNIDPALNAGYPYLRWQTFPNEPIVAVKDVIDINSNYATAVGQMSYLGNSAVTQHGFCWNTSGYPTINDYKTEDGPIYSAADFESEITGLQSNSTYYLRAYAVNSYGISYSGQLKFTTISINGIVPEGSGTESDPYRIANLENLYWLTTGTANWDKYYIQTADIDASSTAGWFEGAGWIPIGNSTVKFTGSYDGQKHVINGLYVNRGADVGFFGYTSEAIIKNLGLSDININGSTVAGGLVGVSDTQTEISVCYTTGSVHGGGYVGGLIGINRNSSIYECFSTCGVFADGGGSSNTGVGGFAGVNAGQINNCFSFGNIEDSSYFVDPNQDHWYMETHVTAGFTGWNYSGQIDNCYSIGRMIGRVSVAGFAVGGIVNNCFWEIESSEIASSKGGTGKTTAEMKMMQTYFNSGWDFIEETNNGTEDIWGINEVSGDNDGYPFLSWQNFTHNIVHPIISAVSVSEISPNGAQIDWELNYLGNSVIDNYGVCWNTTGNPVVGDLNFTDEGPLTTIGCYTSKINVLSAGTDYYARAYLRSSDSIHYSEQVAFKTFQNTISEPAGSGTESDPYRIASMDNLYWVIENPVKWSSHFIQIADIDAGVTINWDYGKGWISIGNNTSPFNGKYNGQDFIIKNLHINRSDEMYIGFFGYTSGSDISNIGIVNAEIISDWKSGVLIGASSNNSIISHCFTSGNIYCNASAGGLVGENYSSQISNCHSSVNIIDPSGRGYYLGGLIGQNQNSNVTGCYATGSVLGGTGTDNSGGFIGINNGSTVSSCYSTGCVTGDVQTGGFVGANVSSSNITNSYSIGNVTGYEKTGGFCGLNNSVIEKCYSIGCVIGNVTTGGFNASNSGTITNSFWDTQTSGLMYSAGGTGKTTVLMKSQATFTTSGWDFIGESTNGTADLWDIGEQYSYGYPFLSYQIFGADPIVITQSVKDINSTYATIDCKINYPGDNGITQYGVCWNTTGNPDIFDNKTELGASVSCGNYISETAGLSVGTLYYVRAYAEYQEGVAYGNIIIFSTLEHNITAPSGTGTVDAPYIVESLDNLYWITVNSGKWSSYYIQTCDIDASETAEWYDGQGWMPIGNYKLPFKGAYDGLGHVINGLVINIPTGMYIGLFGSTNLAQISNLGLTNVNVTGDMGIGSMVGDNIRTNFMNCYSTGTITGSYGVGGLIGFDEDSWIDCCFTKISVTGDHYVGGLIGETSSTEINNCYSLSSIISNDYTDEISGGLIGESISGNIHKSYFAGTMQTTYYDGAIIGYNSYTTLSGCFWDIETTGTTDGVGNQNPDPAGCLGKTTAEMKTGTTYTAAGWDFVKETANGTEDYWNIDTNNNEGYPYLSWENYTGIEEDENNLPVSTNLYQNYPNPFNPETTIKYSLSSDAKVKLVVYDITGREVTELVNMKQIKGWHEAQFNAERLTSGMYFYRLSVDNKVVASKKMMMLK